MRAIILCIVMFSLSAASGCESGRLKAPTNARPQPISLPEKQEPGRQTSRSLENDASATRSLENDASATGVVVAAKPPESIAEEKSSPATNGEVASTHLAAVPACEGGFDVPLVDFSEVPWWNEITAEAREAMLRSTIGGAWDERSKAPIVLYRIPGGLELRSVDGCWRQVITGERGPTWVIDGSSATAWGWVGDELRLLDLLATDPPFPVASDLSSEFPILLKDPGGPSVVIRDFWFFGRTTPSKRPQTLELHWTSEPQLVLRRGEASKEIPLSSETKAWLSSNHTRFSPETPRTIKIDISSASPIAQEHSRCRNAELCLAAAPLGATNREWVRYGEIDVTKRDDTAMGPTCAVYDPSDGTWYSDLQLERKAANPREFAEDDTACGLGLRFDVTGRAFLWNGLLCVGDQCRSAVGAIGFVRGNFFFTAGED